MANNYGSLEGVIEPHGLMTGEIQFNSASGGKIKDVQVNDVSVVDANGVAKIDLTPYAEIENVYDKQTIDTALEGKADIDDIPTELSDLTDDENHRLVTDTEKNTWDNKSDFSGSYNDLTDKPTLGTASALDVASSGDASTSQVVKGDDTRLTDARPASDVSSWAKASTKPDYTASEVGAIATTAKGTANGVAELDENGKVPSAQLPSYVDDVLEYASVSVFPATGESGKIYIALDTNKTYRWSGTTYTEISESLALGETDSTAYAGNKGKQNADNIAAIQGLIPSSATTSNKLATASDIPDISGKADKSEMSVSTSGDQTTIQLKNGTSATVLNAHQSITGKADKVTNATENNFAALDANGNLKDSGHKHSDYLTQHQDISGKADKVTSATNGNLAGLDASGNLTDSGWNGAKDTTSISGNPISIPNLKSNQLAVNPIITLEPIQAGSGTPSPSNIRAISGYNGIEVLSCGVNIWDEQWELGQYSQTNGSPVTTSSNIRSKSTNPIRVSANTKYYLSSPQGVRMFFYDNNFEYLSNQGSGSATSFEFTTPANTAFIRFHVSGTYGTTYNNNISINCPSSQTSYNPYHKTTDLSESLGQTVYWGELDVRSGKFKVIGQLVDLSTLSWGYSASAKRYEAALPNAKSHLGRSDEVICEKYETDTGAAIGDSYKVFVSSTNIYIYDASQGGEPTGNCAYKIATPFTIQLTPHEISLLSQYAYVSTNGTTITLDYHNGEMAALSDVAQLSETVENAVEYLEDYIGANNIGNSITLNTENTSSTNLYVFPSDGYLYLNSGSVTSGNISVPVYGANGAVACCEYMIVTASNQRSGLFVKKGMKCYVSALTTGASVSFRPLE